MSDQIRAAANAVAEARANAEKAQTSLAEAQSGRQCLQARIASIASERSEVIAARRAGTIDPEAGLKLAVLEADEKDISGMMVDADDAVRKALDTSQAAQAAVARTEQQLDMSQAVELERRLLEHAEKLAALLQTTLNELTDVGKRVGRSRPLFAPSPELANTLQRLHLTAVMR